MEEMVRKLEEGADPEGLEEQFGDLLGDEEGGDPMGDMGELDDAGSDEGTVGAFRGPPRKDETLYEFE